MNDLRDNARRDDDENNARAAAVAPADPLGPADRYGELFVAVQSARVFADSKTFVDCAPLRDPDEILATYRARHAQPGFDLAGFVHAHFRAEHPPASHYVSDPDQTLLAHIDGLWNVLTRQPREHPGRSSLLPLPNPYVVPGGRFGEMYYWDSYFTMLGLAGSGRQDLLRDMAGNFAYLIDTYGHVPNGNRSYYLSRSQPPMFALMVELFERHGVRDAMRYLPRLRREYDFWMQGSADLRRGEACGHCVRMADGALLNRYWDARDIPREEAWAEDVATAARQSARPAAEVYRELRAAAASFHSQRSTARARARARCRKSAAVASSPLSALRRTTCISSLCSRALRSIGTMVVVRMVSRPPPSSHQRELKSQPEAAAARSSR